MTRRDKRWALLFLALAVVTMLLLSVSLSNLQFQSGQPFSLGQAPPPPGGTAEIQGPSDIILLIIRGLLALSLLLVPVYILFNLLTPEGRRKLLGDIVVLLTLFLAAEILSRLSRNVIPQPQQPSEDQGGLTFPTPAGPVATFTAQSTPWLEIAAIVVLAMLIAMGIGAIYWYYRYRRETPSEPGPLDQLAQEAQEAVDALRAGENIKDIVIRSYVQMSRVLHQERGIQREIAMTPHEFEQTLADKGFPEEPVHNLTRLFEEVRYGTKRPGALEEQQAIASLSAIVAFCKGAGATQS